MGVPPAVLGVGAVRALEGVPAEGGGRLRSYTRLWEEGVREIISNEDL